MGISKGANYDISEYSFQSFSPVNKDSDKVLDYEFGDLEKNGAISKKEHQKIIRIEREYAKKSGFEISPVVSHFRGLKDQEKEELDSKISQEIDIRFEKIKAEAYQEGLKRGFEQGRDEIYKEMKMEIEEKLSLVTDLISETLNYKAALFAEEKKKLYHLVKNLTKWIILKELNDDDDYLNRLLEKLINEINTKSNLLIQVNKKYFNKMPDVLEIITNKLSNLEKVRMEVDFEIEGPGIILSSNNSLIDGSLLEQFKSLDKLFLPVGLAEDEGNLDLLSQDLEKVFKGATSVESKVEEVNKEEIEEVNDE